MNFYLQSAVANLNSHIKEMEELRDQLQRTAGYVPEAKVEVMSSSHGKRSFAAAAGKVLSQKRATPPLRVKAMKRGPYKKRAAAVQSRPDRSPIAPRRERAKAPGELPGVTVLKRRSKGGSLSDYMRQVIAGYSKPFTREQLQQDIEKRWPNNPDLAKKLKNLSIYLIDMVDRGELTRKGVGQAPQFSKARLKQVKAEVAAAQTNYEQIRSGISVPRDPDVETPPED